MIKNQNRRANRKPFASYSKNRSNIIIGERVSTKASCEDYKMFKRKITFIALFAILLMLMLVPFIERPRPQAAFRLDVEKVSISKSGISRSSFFAVYPF